MAPHSKSSLGVLGVAVLVWAMLQTLALPAEVTLAQGGDGQRARVIVALWAPPPGVDVYAQAQLVAAAQADVLAAVSPADFQPTYRYQVVPGLVGEVTQQGLEVLQRLPQVRAVAYDLPVEAALSESTRVIHADRVWNELGFTGAGVTVAVLDSGVDLSHPDLSDSIIGQYCFNHGTCPPGNTDQGTSAQDQHGHGTHVAAIITSQGRASPRGIAPEAGILAVRVLNQNGSGWTSDVVAGMDWVVANQARFNVRILNLSLGGGAYAGLCDNADANAMLYAASVQAARQSGMVVFAASGNGGLTEQMMTPACVSGVVAVGSTYDANLGPFQWGNASSPLCIDANAMLDQITCTSNSSTKLDILAPGALITAAALGGGQANKSGTSMATPHASAVAALMLQAQPGLSADQIASILRETGVPVVDGRNGRITPRVDALAAVQRVAGGAPGGGGSLSGTVLLQGRNNHSGTFILLQPTCGMAFDAATAASAAVATTDSRGYFQVASAQNAACLVATHPGFLSAQRVSPSGNLGSITLPGGDVISDNVINIYDMAFIASRYGGGDPVCDFTGDGRVDIFDLVIAANNYEKRGPVSDWR